MVPTTYGPGGRMPVEPVRSLGDEVAECRKSRLDGLDDALAALVRLLVGKQHLQVWQVGRLLDVRDDAVAGQLVVARERRLRAVRLDAGVVGQGPDGTELVDGHLDRSFRRTATLLRVDAPGRVLHLLDRLATEALQHAGHPVDAMG